MATYSCQMQKGLTMDKTMLRRALWEFLRPLITLITNLLNPEKGEEVLTELNKFNRKEPCWVPVVKVPKEDIVYLLRIFNDQTIKVGDQLFRVYRIIKNGTLRQLFESLGGDLSKLAFESEDDVNDFCRLHPDKLTSERGALNFFLFKKGDTFVVAEMRIDGNGKFVWGFGAFYKLGILFDNQGSSKLHAQCRHRVVVREQ